MCGIVGIISLKEFEDPKVLGRMSERLTHRGPDDSGIWIHKSGCIGLAHQRLSVVDLTSSGHQPMLSSNGRFSLVFNGEIYNHKNLREELRLSDWRGTSDTETLLRCVEIWGIDKTLEKVDGMYAFALWDEQNEVIYLVRDRMGEKPLYFGWQGGDFLFGSELKAFKEHPKFKGELDRASLELYFQYNYIPSPYSIYKGISKLEPGSILTLRRGEREYSIRKYWSICSKAQKDDDSLANEADLISELDELITESVRQRMESDVPLGVFLSSGVDSSTIASIMQSLANKPIQTFTIGFEDDMFDEAKSAKLISDHLKTIHNELYVAPEDLLDVISMLPVLYDEPFADASQIPTYLVSKMTREKVVVVLSGDGGDELFCGYNRHHFVARYWKRISRCPLYVRKLMSALLLLIPVNVWNKVGGFLASHKGRGSFGLKVQKTAVAIRSNNIFELYSNLLSNWRNSDNLVLGVDRSGDQKFSNLEKVDGVSDVEQMMLWDMQSYLPDDILVKLDRASMGVSLEGRAPFLSKDLVDFACRLPIKYKYKNGKGKWLLRQVLNRYLPKELVDRPKSGFTLPISDWLRGPLKSWAEVLIDKERLDNEGFLNSELIDKKWKEHQSGYRDWSSQLWSVLVFQLWLEENVKP